MGGQGTKWSRKIAENFNCLSRVHQRYRQTTCRLETDTQTDGRRPIANVNSKNEIDEMIAHVKRHSQTSNGDYLSHSYSI